MCAVCFPVWIFPSGWWLTQSYLLQKEVVQTYSGWHISDKDLWVFWVIFLLCWLNSSEVQAFMYQMLIKSQYCRSYSKVTKLNPLNYLRHAVLLMTMPFLSPSSILSVVAFCCWGLDVFVVLSRAHQGNTWCIDLNFLPSISSWRVYLEWMFTFHVLVQGIFTVLYKHLFHVPFYTECLCDVVQFWNYVWLSNLRNWFGLEEWHGHINSCISVLTTWWQHFCIWPTRLFYTLL